VDGGRSSILQNVWTWEHCVDVVLIDYFIEIMLLGSLCFILRISFKEDGRKQNVGGIYTSTSMSDSIQTVAKQQDRKMRVPT
jgi:hypothetical protein